VTKRAGEASLFVNGPEAFNEFPISGASFDVKFTLVEVFELRVLFHGLDETNTAPEENSHDFERGLLTIDSHHKEGMLAEFVIDSLKETVQEVVGLVQDNTLTLILLVVYKIE
jgi:hypothetical protein